MKKKRVKKGEIEIEFPGYEMYNCQTQFIPYPMVLEQYWWALSGSEQKVLDFIIRKTFGWQKQSDYIAISQFTDGDKTGGGVGLSRSQVKRAINSLEKKKFIQVERCYKRVSKFTLPYDEDTKVFVDKEGSLDAILKPTDAKAVKNMNKMFGKNYFKEVLENRDNNSKFSI